MVCGDDVSQTAALMNANKLLFITRPAPPTALDNVHAQSNSN